MNKVEFFVVPVPASQKKTVILLLLIRIFPFMNGNKY